MTKLVIKSIKKQGKSTKRFMDISQSIWEDVSTGIYVGEDSRFEQRTESRTDVVNTEAYQDSGTSLAGWMFRR